MSARVSTRVPWESLAIAGVTLAVLSLLAYTDFGGHADSGSAEPVEFPDAVAGFRAELSLKTQLEPEETSERSAVTTPDTSNSTSNTGRSVTVDRFERQFSDDRPLGLFDRDTYRGLVPDRETFDRWCDWLTEEERDELWANDVARRAYEEAVQFMALQAFVIAYGEREIERRESGQASVPLRDELTPVMPWLYTETLSGDMWYFVDTLGTYDLAVREYVSEHGELPYVGDVPCEQELTSMLADECDTRATLYLNLKD